LRSGCENGKIPRDSGRQGIRARLEPGVESRRRDEEALFDRTVADETARYLEYRRS
jgi:hypothetical protein